jgi:hypothetical protein
VPKQVTEPTLSQLIHPSTHQLPAAIRVWEEIVAERPDDIAALEKLLELYSRQIRLHPDDVSSRARLERQQEIREQIAAVRSRQARP